VARFAFLDPTGQWFRGQSAWRAARWSSRCRMPPALRCGLAITSLAFGCCLRVRLPPGASYGP